MALRSLALQTDLIFNRFHGSVEDRGDYMVVRTPTRPTFFWGNYIIMKDLTRKNDLSYWTAIFENEIGKRSDKGFVVIAIDSTDSTKTEFSEFEQAGFKVNSSKVLTTKSPTLAPKYNSDIEIRPLSSDKEWGSYIDIHFRPAWGYGSDESQKKFLQTEIAHLRKMSEAGLGLRYGAFLNQQIVAELGIYLCDGIARFNNVGTHRDFQRLGACSTLVYEVSKKTLGSGKAHTLVMQADEDYHAARIYESVGFTPTQKLITLEWHDPKMFT